LELRVEIAVILLLIVEVLGFVFLWKGVKSEQKHIVEKRAKIVELRAQNELKHAELDKQKKLNENKSE
jgi:Tfp pilus assembly protein PilO